MSMQFADKYKYIRLDSNFIITLFGYIRIE